MMMDAFDPYRKWLGIPEGERPADYYRLLGIERFERDVDVIANAADRQMAHVRTFQSGPHAKESQQLLNELAAARVCLLNADRKAAYDQGLKAAMASVGASPSQPPAVSQVPPAIGPGDANQGFAVTSNASPPVLPKIKKTGRPKVSLKKIISAWLLMFLVAAVCFFVVTYAFRVLRGPGQQAEVEPSQPTDQPVTPVETHGDQPADIETTYAHGGGQNDIPDDVFTSSDYEPSVFEPEEPSDVLDEPPAVDPVPQPDEETVVAALTRLENRYADDIEKTKEDVSARYRFARWLSEREMKLVNDPVEQFALWRLAIREAVLAGDAAGAQAIADEMEKAFILDDPLEFRVGVMKSVNPFKRGRNLQTVELLAMVESVLASRDFDSAETLNEVADQRLRDPFDKAVNERIDEQKERITAIRDAYESGGYRPAFEMLEVEPTNAEANSLAGRFACFYLNDWEQGLPYLANACIDSTCSPAATAELSLSDEPQLFGDSDAEAICDVADLWWEVAESEDWPELCESNIRRHAASLYEQVDLSVLDAQRRLEVAEILEQVEQTSPADVPPSSMSRLECRLPRQHTVWSRVQGMNTQSELAVQAAIEWILQHQRPDGAFRSVFHSATPPVYSDGYAQSTGPTSPSSGYGTSSGYSSSTPLAAPSNPAPPSRSAYTGVPSPSVPSYSGSSTPSGYTSPSRYGSPQQPEESAIACTALALLPLLAEYPSASDPRIEEAIAGGLNYLRGRANVLRPDLMSFQDTRAPYLPTHAWVTTAFCEALALKRKQLLEEGTKAAVEFIVLTQNPDGGWGQTPRGITASMRTPSSLGYTAWNLQALFAAERAGIDVPDSTWVAAADYLLSMRVDAGGRVMYRYSAGDVPADTATAIGYCCEMLLDSLGRWPDVPAIKEGQGLDLVAKGPDTGDEFLYNYYVTWLVAGDYRQGGLAEQAPGWNDALRRTLLPEQECTGLNAGAWDIYLDDGFSSQVGPMYPTCLAVLMLQAPYRYPPFGE